MKKFNLVKLGRASRVTASMVTLGIPEQNNPVLNDFAG
jgi:hypothetical protein